MRRLLCLSIVFVLLTAATPILAQRFQAGLLAGLNMGQIHGDDLAGYHQPGLNAGLRTSASLSNKLNLGIEFLYSQQGSDRVPGDPFSRPYDNIRLNMVEVPVMLMLTEWKFQLAAGMSYSRLINYSIRDIGGVQVSSNYILDPNGLSGLLGATWLFENRWGLDMRWTRAILPMDSRPSSGSGVTVDRFYSYFVSLRALYRLGG
jgi:hypothetical protein